MQMIDLYHGGEAPVFAPRCVSPNAPRPLDFGTGFYTTTSWDQARKWIDVRIRQHVYESGVISHYTFDQAVLAMLGLKGKVFKSADSEWFDFVMNNRRTPDFSHDYDFVMGPVANDNVYETLTLFEDGIITKDEAIVRLKTYKLVDQILFHTAQALTYLHFVDSEAVV